jgi:hypothetical protein
MSGSIDVRADVGPEIKKVIFLEKLGILFKLDSGIRNSAFGLRCDLNESTFFRQEK